MTNHAVYPKLIILSYWNTPIRVVFFIMRLRSRLNILPKTFAGFTYGVQPGQKQFLIHRQRRPRLGKGFKTQIAAVADLLQPIQKMLPGHRARQWRHMPIRIAVVVVDVQRHDPIAQRGNISAEILVQKMQMAGVQTQSKGLSASLFVKRIDKPYRLVGVTAMPLAQSALARKEIFQAHRHIRALPQRGDHRFIQLPIEFLNLCRCVGISPGLGDPMHHHPRHLIMLTHLDHTLIHTQHIGEQIRILGAVAGERCVGLGYFQPGPLDDLVFLEEVGNGLLQGLVVHTSLPPLAAFDLRDLQSVLDSRPVNAGKSCPGYPLIAFFRIDMLNDAAAL